MSSNSNPQRGPPPSKVLIVDEQPSDLSVLEKALGELGAQLVRVASGAQAVARTLDDDYAAIVLDLSISLREDFATARQIRSRPRSHGTPLLFMTGAGVEPAGMEQAYALGAVELLGKPLQPQVLKSKVACFVALHRSREELREAQRLAMNERAFLTAVLDAVQDGIVACDAQGRLTLFNRAAREWHGRAPESVPAETWPDRYRLFRPDGRTLMQPQETPLARALAGEQVRQSEMVVHAANGQFLKLLASGQPLHDTATGQRLGAVVSMHDVTAQRDAAASRQLAVHEQARRESAEAAAERLRISEERYRTLFESMDEGFCVIDVLFDAQGQPYDYVYVEANPTFARQTGMHEVVGRRMRELMPDGDPTWLEAYGQVALTGQPQRQLHHLRDSGRSFDVSMTRVGDSSSRRVALLGSEVTERVRAEQGWRQLADELAESDRRKTEFLATLAHELRNPLAPLRNGLYVLRHSQDEKARARVWEMMDRQLGHMVWLIDDLLDMARVSTGKVELRKQLTELRPLVDSAVETSQPLLDQHGHTLSVDLPAEPIWVEVDPTRISQVLANLLSNSAKYTPAGGHIVIKTRREGQEAVVSVRDNGVGIRAEDLSRVFQMFMQVGTEKQHATGGLGIGLALVQYLVQMHGGSIRAESEGIGRGSTFTVRIPVATQVDAPPALPAGAVEPEAHVGLNVLVVDDNQDAAESLALILQIDGHVARVAHSGLEALELAREFLPQVVFLDIGMPGMDGYEVARTLLRQQGISPKPVLVALTGWGAQEDLERAKAAGFDHHLTKPADIAAVEQLLSTLRIEA